MEIGGAVLKNTPARAEEGTETQFYPWVGENLPG